MVDTTEASYRFIHPVLEESQVHNLVGLCEKVGRYRMAGVEMTSTDIGAGLPERFECFYDLAKQRGHENQGTLDSSHADWLDFERAFTTQFREIYAERGQARYPEAEPLLHHEAFISGARELLDRPVIVPAFLLSNVYVAGQRLAAHTDITEFRGMSRKTTPQWLLICMHHSRLFDEWRLPIATAVSFFNVCEGGDFRFYPEGAATAPVTAPRQNNSAVLMDADSFFHEVRPVYEPNGLPAPLERGQTLYFGDDRNWRVVAADGTNVGTYSWDEVRFSVSWKAYCFRDEAERQSWAEHSNDLSIEFIVERLTTDLLERALLHDRESDNLTFARAVVDAYYHAPAID